MQFKVSSGTLPLDGKGLLMVLTRKQAERRRHLIRRVMPDGSKVSVLPAIMKPAPELPELGTYSLAGACEFKVGETIAFPDGVDVVGVLGKERMLKLKAMDDAAAKAVEPVKAKAEKVPKPAHGGPAAFQVSKSLEAGKAAAGKVAEPPKAPAPAPVKPSGPQSISRDPGKK